MAKIYTCTGSCHGVATEKQFRSGATTCGAETCERFGKPLEPKTQCPDCQAVGDHHACGNCQPA